MQVWMMPPTLGSILQDGVVNIAGPHHFENSAQSVHALQTSSLGALKTRVISSCLAELALFSAMLGLPLFGLDCAQVFVQPVEPLLPDHPIPLDPMRDFFEGLRLETAGAPLGLAALLYKAGACQHFYVSGYGGHAHAERLREVSDRGFAAREPGKYRPPRRIGEGRKRGGQPVRSHR